MLRKAKGASGALDGTAWMLRRVAALVHPQPHRRKGVDAASVYTSPAAKSHTRLHRLQRFERAERVAKEMGFPANSYTVIKCELGSFKSVRDFVFNLRAFKGPRGLDALVCNAAVYLPVRAAASSVILNVSASTPSS